MLKLMTNVRPDSLRSPLKRNCSTKWIENCDVVFVFKEFYPAVVGSLDQLSESKDGEVFGRATNALFESDNNS